MIVRFIVLAVGLTGCRNGFDALQQDGSTDAAATTPIDATPIDATAPRELQGLAYDWSLAMVGGSSYALAVDSANNIFLSGQTGQDIDFGGGQLPVGSETDIFVASFTSGGVHRWSSLFGGPTRFDSASGITVVEDTVVVVGAVTGEIDFGLGLVSTQAASSDGYVLTLDSGTGVTHSASLLGGITNDKVGAICSTSQGIAHTGSYSGTASVGGADFSSVQFDEFYVASYASDDMHLWSHAAPGFGNQKGRTIKASANDNLYVGGSFESSFDLGGGQTTTGGTIDSFLVSYDLSGNWRWQSVMTSSNSVTVTSIAVDSNERIVVGGHFRDSDALIAGTLLSNRGYDDAWMASFDQDGNNRWVFSFGTEGTERLNGIAVDGLGNIYVTGEFEGTITLGSQSHTAVGLADVFLAVFREDGTHIWSTSFGTANHEYGTSLSLDSAGNVLFSVNYRASIDFGGGPLAQGTRSSTALVKFAPTY